MIKKKETPDENTLYYVALENVYDVIKRAHVATGHGGRDKMLKELAKKYVNVQKSAVNIFISLC